MIEPANGNIRNKLENVMREEAVCYNALALATESNYQKLQALHARHKTWRGACGSFALRGLEPEKEFAKLEKIGVSLILQGNPDYPSVLKEIPMPPFGIYIRGTLTPGDCALAIVGTRKATEEGLSCAHFFSKSLAAAGVAIVSGLSIGIDGAAHWGALAGNGITIGVLANGLDRLYPSMHEKLAKQILQKNGAIISEYPLGTPPLPYRFLERNRIVSGMAKGVLIIEAPKRSGTLATARHALEQNREVFVLPGPVFHPNFMGSHSLIKSGAALVTEPQDIADALEVRLRTMRQAISVSKEGERIIAALESSTRPFTVDKIIEFTHLQAHEVNRILADLLLGGIVEETARGYILTAK